MSKALKPTFLVNEGGGIIPWGVWLKLPTTDGVDLAAMVFSDGAAVSESGLHGNVRGDFWTLAGREEMRDFAGVSSPIGFTRG